MIQFDESGMPIDLLSFSKENQDEILSTLTHVLYEEWMQSVSVLIQSEQARRLKNKLIQLFLDFYKSDRRSFQRRLEQLCSNNGLLKLLCGKIRKIFEQELSMSQMQHYPQIQTKTVLNEIVNTTFNEYCQSLQEIQEVLKEYNETMSFQQKIDSFKQKYDKVKQLYTKLQFEIKHRRDYHQYQDTHKKYYAQKDIRSSQHQAQRKKFDKYAQVDPQNRNRLDIKKNDYKQKRQKCTQIESSQANERKILKIKDELKALQQEYLSEKCKFLIANRNCKSWHESELDNDPDYRYAKLLRNKFEQKKKQLQQLKAKVKSIQKQQLRQSPFNDVTTTRKQFVQETVNNQMNKLIRKDYQVTNNKPNSYAASKAVGKYNKRTGP